jgi:hypothetical protein
MGDTKFITAEKHNETRREAKARQKHGKGKAAHIQQGQTLFQAIRKDRREPIVDATREALQSKLSKYPDALQVVEFACDAYEWGIHIDKIQQDANSKFTRGAKLGIRAFKEELRYQLKRQARRPQAA